MFLNWISAFAAATSPLSFVVAKSVVPHQTLEDQVNGGAITRDMEATANKAGSKSIIPF